MSKPVLEPAAQEFADATANPPYLFDLGPVEGRKVVDDVQSPEVEVPVTPKETLADPSGASWPVPTIALSSCCPVACAGLRNYHGGLVKDEDSTGGRIGDGGVTGGAILVRLRHHATGGIP
jgi:hypothetical protein